VSFLLDTDICSLYLKGNGKVFNKIVQYGGGLNLSTVVIGELYTWAYRGPAQVMRLQGVKDLIAGSVVIAFDLQIAEFFGQTRAALISKGINIPESDMQIAATALIHNLTVVTHNVRHYTLIPGLRIEDWTA